MIKRIIYLVKEDYNEITQICFFSRLSIID